MSEATLYQFSLCPFCNKVRAALELKGVSYDVVEVAPRDKKELPPLPEGVKKKVPVLVAKGETVVDSTAILKFIEENFSGTQSLSPKAPEAAQRAEEIEDWVDETFIQALPTVIYGTRKEAAQAASIIARESNFTGFQRFKVNVFGSAIMRQIAKRILKKHGRTDAHAWVSENVTQFAAWLEDQQFVTGDDVSLADASMHGAMTCVKDFPVFAKLTEDPKVAAWYERVSGMRAANRAS